MMASSCCVTSLLCILSFAFVTQMSVMHTGAALLQSGTGRAMGKALGAKNDTCGDQQVVCHCKGDVADCSGHSRLLYVPRLPSSVRFLNLSNNKISSIFQDDYFQNVTNITYLSLFANELTYLSPGAFQTLRRLSTLLVNHNDNLNYSVISAILHISSLRKFSASSCNLGPIPSDFFLGSRLDQLQILLLYDNLLGDTNLTVFRPLSGLQSLGLANNRITRIYQDFVSGLGTLNLNSNGLFAFPVTCLRGSQSSMYPNLTHLLLRTNVISAIAPDVCLPSLRVLELSENKFSVLYTNAFGEDKFPLLIELYLFSMNNHIGIIYNSTFSNPSLQRIALTYDGIQFSDPAISGDSFANCPQLQDLQLSHNFVSITEDRFLQLFGHLFNLEYLYIENSEIHRLTPRMFSSFQQLRILSFNRNSLSLIPDGLFDGLKSLVHLDLSDNQISVLSPNMFSKATRQRLTFLDLSNNPFACSCDVVWFQIWLRSNPRLFKKSWGKYTCHNYPGLLVKNFFLDEQACLLSHSAYLMIAVLTSLLILSFSVVFTIFRYRWHLRLVLYEAFRGQGGTRRRRLEADHFDYDVFVSHAAEDLPWVCQHLIPKLEEQLGLKLCLHERDFIPGKNIIDNIADCLAKSRKVLMVFSANFVQSQWCQFELSMC